MDTAKFSSRLLSVLRRDGWSPEREEPIWVEKFEQTFGEDWLPCAAPVVRSFGGLFIDHILWIKPIHEFVRTPLFQIISEVVGARVCPIAASNYMGDGCSVWIDENCRFYAVDGEGMEYVGEEVSTAFEVLIFGSPPPSPPGNIAAALAKTYDWDDLA